MENVDYINWENSGSIEQGLSKGGIAFDVSYSGFIEIKHSVKMLNREQRTAVACECITRMHELLHKNKVVKRKLDKGIRDFISDRIDTSYTNSRVIFALTLERFEIRLGVDNTVLVGHDIPKISFASVGEDEFSSYVGYVGTDKNDLRACYIVDCGASRARKIIKAIHLVFEMRSRQKYPIYQTLSIKTVPNVYELKPRQSIKLEKREVNHWSLLNEPWFHGAISRNYAEKLLKCPGDFLVRESSSLPDQLILSCFNGDFQHLQMTDDDGKIRTSNHEFNDIKDFIEFHLKEKLPIICPQQCNVFLIRPITSEGTQV